MSIEAAAARGFRRDQAEPALAILAAMNAPDGTFAVAMDLARFVKVPLGDATDALVFAMMGKPRRLRAYGIVPPPDVDVLDYVAGVVAGQAEAYARTWYGSGDVREATGRTLGHAFEAGLRRAAERAFGPRS